MDLESRENELGETCALWYDSLVFMKELLRGRSGRKYMMDANLKGGSNFSRNYGWNNPAKNGFRVRPSKSSGALSGALVKNDQSDSEKKSEASK